MLMIQSPPYLMLRKETDGRVLSGNDRFEGYCVDLAAILADELQFSYELKLVADSKYGASMDNGSWNGMVGELTRQVSTTDTRSRQQAL